MADTGAPWNIPYVVNADLVKDYPTDSLALANAIASGLSAASIVRQIVVAEKTDTFSASVGVGSTVATGFTVSITPSSASNKILLLANLAISAGTPSVAFWIDRDGSPVGYIGDAASNRRRAIATESVSGSGNSMANADAMFLDAPATTSSVTYEVEMSHGSSGTVSVYLNRSPLDADNLQTTRNASSLIAIEVAV